MIVTVDLDEKGSLAEAMLDALQTIKLTGYRFLNFNSSRSGQTLVIRLRRYRKAADFKCHPSCQSWKDLQCTEYAVGESLRVKTSPCWYKGPGRGKTIRFVFVKGYQSLFDFAIDIQHGRGTRKARNLFLFLQHWLREGKTTLQVHNRTLNILHFRMNTIQ